MLIVSVVPKDTFDLEAMGRPKTNIGKEQEGKEKEKKKMKKGKEKEKKKMKKGKEKEKKKMKKGKEKEKKKRKKKGKEK
ncbi:hypothetical protein M8J76_004938 [Diaphorina citri]|nr:hypothetical protein M8J76_004938 [Diaphorina citri]